MGPEEIAGATQSLTANTAGIGGHISALLEEFYKPDLAPELRYKTGKQIANTISYYVDSDLESAQRFMLVDKTVKYITRIISYFACAYHFSLKLNLLTLADVIRTYSRDIDKMILLDNVPPNIFRQAATFAIWITRLRPLNAKGNRETEYIPKNLTDWAKDYANELFALFFSASLIYAYADENKAQENLSDANVFNLVRVGLKQALCYPCNSDVYEDLISVLRYRVVSRHSLSMFFKMIFDKEKEKASLKTRMAS